MNDTTPKNSNTVHVDDFISRQDLDLISRQDLDLIPEHQHKSPLDYFDSIECDKYFTDNNNDIFPKDHFITYSSFSNILDTDNTDTDSIHVEREVLINTHTNKTNLFDIETYTSNDDIYNKHKRKISHDAIDYSNNVPIQHKYHDHLVPKESKAIITKRKKAKCWTEAKVNCLNNELLTHLYNYIPIDRYPEKSLLRVFNKKEFKDNIKSLNSEELIDNIYNSWRIDEAKQRRLLRIMKRQKSTKNTITEKENSRIVYHDNYIINEIDDYSDYDHKNGLDFL